MKSSIFVFSLFILSTAVLGAGCEKSQSVQEQIIGGDRDAHGCIGSAGYQWCESKSKCLRIWEESCLSPAMSSAAATVLVSAKDSTVYCNGAEMDSEGFRKTITVEKAVTLPSTDRTDTERIKSVLLAATGDRCQTLLENTDISLDADTVTFGPVGGWAGVSISLCGCKPQFEVNLLRLPGIKKVVWR